MSMGLKKTSSGLRNTTSSRALGARDADKKLTSHTLGQVLHELGVDEIEDELSSSSDEEDGPHHRPGSAYHQSQFQLQKQMQQQKHQNGHNSSQQKLQTKISFNGFEENVPMIRIPSQHTLRPPSMQNLHQAEPSIASPPPQAPHRQPSPVVKVILPRRLSHQEMLQEAATSQVPPQPHSHAEHANYPIQHVAYNHVQHGVAVESDAFAHGERRWHFDEDHGHDASHRAQRHVSSAPQQHHQHPGHQRHHFYDETPGPVHGLQQIHSDGYRHPQQPVDQGVYHNQRSAEDPHSFFDHQGYSDGHHNHYNQHGHQSHSHQSHSHQSHHNHHAPPGQHYEPHGQHHQQGHYEPHGQHHQQGHYEPHGQHHQQGHYEPHGQHHQQDYQSQQSQQSQVPAETGGGKHATVPFEENPMLRLKKKPSLSCMVGGDRAQPPSQGPSQGPSPRKAFVDPAAVVAEATGSAAAVLKDFDPRQLPEEQQVKLSLRLTKQASKYGTHMFEELRDVDRSEIETLESFGFAFDDAVERIFTERTDVVVTEVIRDAAADEGALVSEPALAQVGDERQKQHVRRQSLSASVSMIDNPLRRKPSGIPPIEQILAEPSPSARQPSSPGGGSADDATADTATTTIASASATAALRRASTASDSQPGDYSASSASYSSGSAQPPQLQASHGAPLSVQLPPSRPLSRSTSFQSTQSDGAFVEPPSPSSYAGQQRPTLLGQASLGGLASPERPGLSPRQSSGGLPPAGHHRRTSSGASASSIPPLPPRSSASSVASHRSPSPFAAEAAYDAFGAAYRHPSSPSPPPLPPRQASPAPAAYGSGYGYGGPSAGHGNSYGYGYGGQSGYGYGAQSAPSPPPVAPRRSSALPAQLMQQMRVDALSRLSESEQLRVSMLLSTQDERFGANMFDSLGGADLPELDHWLARGFGFEQTALFMFLRKRGAAVGDAPQS